MCKNFLYLFSCLLIFFLLATKPSLAHLSGQPPFFLVNGKFSGFYPIYVTSLKDFSLPQDIAPETYLINQPLSFEIDQTMLPFPPDVIPKMTYSWDFGDGNKGQGTTLTHTYTHMGSYLLTIKADYGGYSDPNTKPLLQAILITVLPNKNYRLPQAQITVDNKKIIDPSSSSLTLTSNDVRFDAGNSKPGSAKIVSYFWDLGDGTSSQKKSLSHSYSDQNQLYIFPMLRVKDANGFISDTYVQLERTAKTTEKQQSLTSFAIPAIILFNILVVGSIIVILRKH